jgi:hypothetical protein
MPNLFVICLIVVCALQTPLARSQSTLICNAQFLDIGGWCNSTNVCPDAYDYCANDNTGNGLCAPSYTSTTRTKAKNRTDLKSSDHDKKKDKTSNNSDKKFPGEGKKLGT